MNNYLKRRTQRHSEAPGAPGQRPSARGFGLQRLLEYESMPLVRSCKENLSSKASPEIPGQPPEVLGQRFCMWIWVRYWEDLDSKITCREEFRFMGSPEAPGERLLRVDLGSL